MVTAQKPYPFLVSLQSIDRFSDFYASSKIKVKTIPPKVKYKPRLNTEVLGINIQNAEITKNNKESPK